jgi:hypothetical protein
VCNIVNFYKHPKTFVFTTPLQKSYKMENRSEVTKGEEKNESNTDRHKLMNE